MKTPFANGIHKIPPAAKNPAGIVGERCRLGKTRRLGLSASNAVEDGDWTWTEAGTVGWVLPVAPLGIDKPEEFATCDARFVSGFCIFFNEKQRPLDPRGAEAFVSSLGGR